MKPIRNRVYCIDACRTKMLFETEKKAMNFIRFNAEEMISEGKKVPVRAYRCNVCGGWHVTSNPNEEMFVHGSRYEMMQRKHELHRERMRQKREQQERIMALQSVYDEAAALFAQGDYKAAVKKVKSYMKLLDSVGGNMACYVMGYQLLYNVVCRLIPEIFANLDTEHFPTAQVLYSQCLTICNYIGDVKGFEEYRSTVGGYMQEAGERIACLQSAAVGRRRLRKIIEGTDIVSSMISQGMYLDAQNEINKYATELQRYVGNMDVYDEACEAVQKLYNVRLMLSEKAA